MINSSHPFLIAAKTGLRALSFEFKFIPVLNLKGLFTFAGNDAEKIIFPELIAAVQPFQLY